jgi:hypothetical protein
MVAECATALRRLASAHRLDPAVVPIVTNFNLPIADEFIEWIAERAFDVFADRPAVSAAERHAGPASDDPEGRSREASHSTPPRHTSPQPGSPRGATFHGAQEARAAREQSTQTSDTGLQP